MSLSPYPGKLKSRPLGGTGHVHGLCRNFLVPLSTADRAYHMAGVHRLRSDAPKLEVTAAGPRTSPLWKRIQPDAAGLCQPDRPPFALPNTAQAQPAGASLNPARTWPGPPLGLCSPAFSALLHRLPQDLGLFPPPPRRHLLGSPSVSPSQADTAAAAITGHPSGPQSSRCPVPFTRLCA